MECPNYLILDVSSLTPYNKTLAENITVDSGVTLTYSSGPVVTVAPWTVGTNDIRVTATDMFGFEHQCAFIVEIKRECFWMYMSIKEICVFVSLHSTGICTEKQ